MTSPMLMSAQQDRLRVVIICFACIVLDGYDLIVYGTVVPVLLKDDTWNLTPAEAGAIGSYTFIGMLVGTLAVGTITDLVGRRKVLLLCLVWLSAGMVLCALAPTPTAFGALRFLTGIGLGGLAPTTIALTLEFAHPRYRSLTNALMFCGYSVGGILAALIALPTVPALGWRTMFWIGAAPVLLLAPLAFFLLPESPSFLAARERRARPKPGTGTSRTADGAGGREDTAPGGTGRLEPLRALFTRGNRRPTLLFGIGMAIGMLLIYGLNTWLAQIMTQGGYSFGSALLFVLALNAGAILGTPVAGAIADRLGDRRVTVTMFLVAALCIFLLSLPLPISVRLLLVAIAGAGTIGTTIQVSSFIGKRYATENRATALGWALSVGRLGAILGPAYGGRVIGSDWGFRANFYAFAIPALLGALAMWAIPRRAPVGSAETPAPSAEADSAR
ncbi:aromatic acid/H+ symport family MFS transporter [Streptomyces sp. SID8352]|uniref:MFS transporter n=1 Tax=Streptomyces sp. SID8352 TaxID=2690338 RepID=UPI0019282C19|nr:aromatic acid/H+ symport family MFS transporter [Streptomyces sp. SID8352]